MLGYAAEDDTVLPAEKNDDITEPYYVFSKDVCVTSPQLRDAALALMSLQSSQHGKQFYRYRLVWISGFEGRKNLSDYCINLMVNTRGEGERRRHWEAALCLQ